MKPDDMTVNELKAELNNVHDVTYEQTYGKWRADLVALLKEKRADASALR